MYCGLKAGVQVLPTDFPEKNLFFLLFPLQHRRRMNTTPQTDTTINESRDNAVTIYNNLKEAEKWYQLEKEYRTEREKLEERIRALSAKEAAARKTKEEYESAARTAARRLSSVLNPAGTAPTKGAVPETTPSQASSPDIKQATTTNPNSASRYHAPARAPSDFIPGDLILINNGKARGARGIVTSTTREYVNFRVFGSTTSATKRFPKNLSRLHPTNFTDPQCKSLFESLGQIHLPEDARQRVHAQLKPYLA